jgi:hypothetical protein
MIGKQLKFMVDALRRPVILPRCFQDFLMDSAG